MDKMSLIALAKASKAGGGGGSFTQEQADWNQTDNTQVDFIKNKPSLSTVATSGNYDDLTNKPTIPEAYTLPTASTDTLGGVKVDGTSITIDDGVISATLPIMPTVDTELDPASDNAIANSAVATEFISMSNDIDLIESDILSTKTTATADIVSITDAQDIPAEDVKADIEPIQDLHGYEYPWVGGAGKNIFDFESWLTARGVTYTKQGNAYTLTANSLVGSENYWEFSDTPINVTLSTTVENGTATNVGFRLKNTVNDEVSTKGSYITMVANAVYIDWTTSGTVTITGPQIEAGSTATSYEPYSNICPITGYDDVSVTRTGKNLVESKLSGYYVNVAGVFLADVTYDMQIARVSANTTYTVTTDDLGGLVCGFFTSLPTISSRTYDSSRVVQESKTFTAPIDGYVAFRTSAGYATPQCEVGNQATVYAPYKGTNTITATFDNTVYSGHVDFTNGVVTVDKAMVDLGDLTWSVMSGQTNTFYTSFTNAGNYYAVCSQYRNVGNQPYLEMINGTIQVRSDYTYIRDNNYTDATTFATAMDGVQLLYELATPQVYSLTPTQIDMLLNNNVLSASTGKIQVKYQPANVIGELKKEIKEVDDKIPTTPFDGKKVLFIGDSFMEGFGARVADGLDSTTNPITTPAVADSTPMRGWAKTFQERYPKAIVHNISIYGATIAYQNNAPSVMGQLTYIATNSIGGEYVVLDGGANDVFQGITKGSAKADDVYEKMNWDTMNYNTYQTIPCLEAIFAIFAEHFPTVRLLYVSPPPMDVTLTEEMQTAMDTMNTEIEALCEKWGVKYIKIIGKGSKNTIYSNNTEYYTASDKIHPLQRFYDETIGQIDEVLKQF